jgi:hypothetical protein
MKITMKDLQGAVNRLNTLVKANPDPYTKIGEVPNQTYRANVGTYFISGAYGGHKLERMATSGGGTCDPLRSGYTTKKDLYHLIWSYIYGIEEGEYQVMKRYHESGKVE